MYSPISQGSAINTNIGIQLDTEERLVKHYYPIPFIYRNQVRKWLDLGAINPGLSKNSCLLVIVKKKNGKISVCFDLILTNSHATQKPLKAEWIDNLLVRFQRVKFISNLGLNDSYTQGPLDKGSQDVIAFTFEGQIYTFSRMITGMSMDLSHYSIPYRILLDSTCHKSWSCMWTTSPYHLKHLKSISPC